jgi:Ca-activated chloride channel family protein
MQLPRPIKNSLLPLLLVFAAQKICAQLAPADEFFNGGAQLYISNNIPAALEKTEGGLKIYPNDEKLQKLEKLLKQQQQSQSSQSQQNQQNQSQQNQSQSQQNSNSQKNQQQNKQQSQEQKQNPADQKKDEQKSNDDKKENESGDKQPVAGQMTPEEAKRLLDTQKGDEQVLQLKPQGKPQDQNKPVKDW